MPLAGQRPFYKASLIVGGLQIPALPGASLINPDNLDIPPIIGNYAQYNYAVGAANPIAEIQFVPRNATGEALSQTFWDYLLRRNSDATNDTNIITGGIQYWDGASGFQMNGAKLEMIGFNVQGGSAIGITARFCCSNAESNGSVPPSIPALQVLVANPGMQPYSSANTLRFQSMLFSLGGSATSEFWDFSMNYTNHHSPDMGMDGSIYPRAQNAGLPTCGVNVRVKAAAGLITDDGTESTISATVVSGAKSFVMNFGRVRDNVPNNRQISAPQVFRQHQFVCLSTDGLTVPLSVVSTGF